MEELPRVTIVAPCYNEAEVLPEFHRRLIETVDGLEGLSISITYVDDGSEDDTLPILRGIAAADDRVRVYSLSRNFGHEVALAAGLDVATGDAVLLMDSDLQHPPYVVPRMIERWRAGSDVVAAVRTRSASASLLKRFTSFAFYRILNPMSETKLLPSASNFCLLSARAHHALRRMPERHRVLRGMISWIGFPRSTVEFEAPARFAGRSKYGFRRMCELSLDSLFSFSGAPIRIITRFGFGILVLGLGYFLYVLGLHLFSGRVIEGWSSLICTILVMSGTQIASLGVIGGYVRRLYEEAKERPLYFFKETPEDARSS